MAVSGKTAAPHEIPYFLEGDKPPNMATVTKAMADQIHARLNVKPLTVGEVSSSGTARGEGFTSERTATGIFKITLTAELPAVGIMVVTPVQAVVARVSAGKKVFTVETFNLASAAINTDFQFMVRAI